MMMRPTPLTGIFLFCVLASVSYAYLMSAAEALAGGVAILAVLFFRAYYFQNAVRSVIEGLQVVRKADRVILRQGAEVHISASLSFPTQTELDIEAEDLIPDSARAVSGSVTYAGEQAVYTLQIPALGRSRFGGVQISCRDLFYTSSIRVTKGTSEPELYTYPTGIAATLNEASGSRWSTVEKDRMAIIAGTDVMMFRPYRMGDSFRNIDWKLTAKHGEVFVRQYTDATGDNPIILVDLPEEGCETEETICLTGAATALIDKANSEGDGMVVFICGGNLLNIEDARQDREIYEMLQQAGHVQRSESQFRLRHPGSMQGEVLKMNGEWTPFSEAVKDILTRHMKRYPTSYEKAMINLLATSDQAQSVHIVTLGRGDLSHLTSASVEAMLRKKTVNVSLTGSYAKQHRDEIQSVFYASGVDYVEVI